MSVVCFFDDRIILVDSGNFRIFLYDKEGNFFNEIFLYGKLCDMVFFDDY